jgi:uncharacterized membrane protein
MARREQNTANRQLAISRWAIIVYCIAAVLALAGLADALYLTVLHLTGQSAVCGGSPSCSQVLASKYAHIGPVPVALLGMLGYFSVFTFAVFSIFKYARATVLMRITVWLMFAVALLLLYLQAFVIHAFCRYCLFSAAITFFLTGLVVATPARPLNPKN